MENFNKLNLRDGDIITEDKLAIIDSNTDKYNANKTEILSTLDSHTSQLNDNVNISNLNLSNLNNNINSLNSEKINSINSSLSNIKEMINNVMLNQSLELLDLNNIQSTDSSKMSYVLTDGILSINSDGNTGVKILIKINNTVIKGHKYRLKISAKTNNTSKTKNFFISDLAGLSKGVSNDFFLKEDYSENYYNITATESGDFYLSISSTQFNSDECIDINEISLKEVFITNNDDTLLEDRYSLGNCKNSSNGTSSDFQIRCINDNSFQIEKKTTTDNRVVYINLKDNIETGSYILKFKGKTSVDNNVNNYFYIAGSSNNIFSTSEPFHLSKDVKEYEIKINVTDVNSKILMLKSNWFRQGEIINISDISFIKLNNIECLNISKPRPVIYETDWWTDVDDVIATRILLDCEKKRMIDIVCMVIDACQENSVPSLDAFCNAEGRPNMTIGIDRDATDFGGEPIYQANMLNYPHSYKTSSDAEDAVRMYRRALTNSFEKVDIICIGYPHVLANLLKSTADDISNLDGVTLVSRKVNKIWCMGGKYPSGIENNFARNNRAKSGASWFVHACPVPITFLGWECAENVIVGEKIFNYCNENNDIVAKALYDFNISHGFDGHIGRNAWDPMLVVLACYNDFYKCGYTSVKGINFIDYQTGKNTFTQSDTGLHEYVVKINSDEWYEEMINNLIITQNKIGSVQLSK